MDVVTYGEEDTMRGTIFEAFGVDGGPTYEYVIHLALSARNAYSRRFHQNLRTR